MVTVSLNSGLRIHKKVSRESLSQRVRLSLTSHISRADGQLPMLRECVKAAGCQVVSGHAFPPMLGRHIIN